MTGWEALRETGLFDFGEAEDTAWSLLQSSQSLQPSDLISESNLSLTRDLTLLGGASARLIDGMAGLDSQGPVLPLTVRARHARAAFLTFACTLTVIHGRRAPSQLALADVLPYSGDVKKFNELGVNSALELYQNFQLYTDGLAELYRSSASDFGRAVVEAGWLVLAQAVWFATLLRLMDPAIANAQTMAYITGNLVIREIPGAQFG
jgi:hypothetical protein